MAADIFAQVINLIEQLDENQQEALVQHLQQITGRKQPGLTRELILREQEARLDAGYAENLPSLVGLFPHPGTDLSFEAIEKAIHEDSWESELDEFFGDS